MADQEILARYALALHLIPDPDVAADLFMDARDEADLQRRAMAWRAARRLPPPPATPLPQLDDDEVAHALHLARRAKMRRQIRPVLSVVASVLVLVSAAVLVNDLKGNPGTARAGGPELPVARTAARTGPLPVMSLSGRLAKEELPACGQAELMETDAGLVLLLNMPYAPGASDDPYISSAILDELPKGKQPGKISLEVRGQEVNPVAFTCYRMVAAMQLPAELRGKHFAFEVNVRPEAWRNAMSWTTDPVQVPDIR
jgi:hypothetical protein